MKLFIFNRMFFNMFFQDIPDFDSQTENYVLEEIKQNKENCKKACEKVENGAVRCVGEFFYGRQRVVIIIFAVYQ